MSIEATAVPTETATPAATDVPTEAIAHLPSDPSAPTAPTTPEQVNAQPEIIKVNTSNLLEVAFAVLQHLGKPAHHEVMRATAKELFGVDKDIATPVWSDTRRPQPHVSRFTFLGGSVYGLAEWPYKKGDDISEFKPTRAKATNSAALSIDQLEKKVERLTIELDAARKALETAKANPEAHAASVRNANSGNNSAPANRQAPSRAAKEDAKDAAILASLPAPKPRPAK